MAMNQPRHSPARIILGLKGRFLQPNLKGWGTRPHNHLGPEGAVPVLAAAVNLVQTFDLKATPRTIPVQKRTTSKCAKQ
jgi:hypothetical protein